MTLVESIVDGIADIKAHKGRTFLQALGVVLGVASVVTTMALVESGQRQMKQFFAQIGGLRKILILNEPSREITRTAMQMANVGLTWEDAMALREIPYLTQVDPIAMTRVTVRQGDHRREWNLEGVTPDYQPIYKFYPGRGRFISLDDLQNSTRVCVLGDTVAREIFGSDDPLGRTVFFDDVGMTVVGVMARKEYWFNKGTHNALEWMNRKIFVPLTTVHRRFTGDERRRVAYINAILDDPKNTAQAKQAIEQVLASRHRGVRDFMVQDRSSRLAEQEQRSQMLNIVFIAAGVVSLVVGGVVIMNILLASFQERVREVGVRKALGANGLHIAAQFLVESVLVTLLGGGLGILLGIGFSSAVSSMIGQPAIVTPSMAMMGFVTAGGVGIFFGFYPAVKAARLDPVSALRYE